MDPMPIAAAGVSGGAAKLCLLRPSLENLAQRFRTLCNWNVDYDARERQARLKRALNESMLTWASLSKQLRGAYKAHAQQFSVTNDQRQQSLRNGLAADYTYMGQWVRAERRRDAVNAPLRFTTECVPVALDLMVNFQVHSLANYLRLRRLVLYTMLFHGISVGGLEDDTVDYPYYPHVERHRARAYAARQPPPVTLDAHQVTELRRLGMRHVFANTQPKHRCLRVFCLLGAPVAIAANSQQRQHHVNQVQEYMRGLISKCLDIGADDTGDVPGAAAAAAAAPAANAGTAAAAAAASAAMAAAAPTAAAAADATAPDAPPVSLRRSMRRATMHNTQASWQRAKERSRHRGERALRSSTDRRTSRRIGRRTSRPQRATRSSS